MARRRQRAPAVFSRSSPWPSSSWAGLTCGPTPGRGRDYRVETKTAPQDDLKPEVEKLSEKIRAAHLNKDINKWLSCYYFLVSQSGATGKRMLELWKNYDIKEVNYRISNVQRVSDKEATADIVWNIQLYDHRTHDYTLVRQISNHPGERSGGWKIRDSKEVAGG